MKASFKAKIQRRLLQLSNGGVMHESVYKEIRPTGSLRTRLHGLPKVHKKSKSLFDQFYLWLAHRNTLWKNIWQLLLIRFNRFTQAIA